MTVKRIAFGLVFLLVAALLVVGQQAIGKKREFNGPVTISICEKGSAGSWQVVDQVLIPQITFTASVADNMFKTDYQLNTKTKNGKDFAMRATRPGKADTNVEAGSSTFEFPVEITMGGQKAMATFNMTTESTQGPTGMISGKRAKINMQALTAEVTLVGSATVKMPPSLPTDVNAKKEEKTEMMAKGPREMLFVIQADARPLKAMD